MCTKITCVFRQIGSKKVALMVFNIVYFINLLKSCKHPVSLVSEQNYKTFQK